MTRARVTHQHRSLLASLKERGTIAESELGTGTPQRRRVTDLLERGLVQREWDYGLEGYYVSGYSITRAGRAALGAACS